MVRSRMGDIHAFTLYTYHGEAFKSSLYCACTLDMYTYYRKSYYIHGIGSLVTYKMECNVITCEDNEIMRPWCGMDRNVETSSLWCCKLVPGCLKDMIWVGIKKKIWQSSVVVCMCLVSMNIKIKERCCIWTNYATVCDTWIRKCGPDASTILSIQLKML